MSEYQRTIAIEAKPDDVFDFVSDINNLPKYLPTVESATPQHDGGVRVTGKAGDKAYDYEGYFRIDKESRHIEWGSNGEQEYSGWIQVENGVEEVFTSRVIVHLTFEPNPEVARQLEKQAGDKDTAINEGIDEALRAIKNLCEDKGEKGESQSAS
jgi:uncharacterized membrane protein